jgi:putative membrane protein
MIKIIANWILNALALFLVSRIILGIELSDFWSALVAIAVIGLVNALIKPMLLILTFPITILTLVIYLVINALMLFCRKYHTGI